MRFLLPVRNLQQSFGELVVHAGPCFFSLSYLICNKASRSRRVMPGHDSLTPRVRVGLVMLFVSPLIAFAKWFCGAGGSCQAFIFSLPVSFATKPWGTGASCRAILPWLPVSFATKNFGKLAHRAGSCFFFLLHVCHLRHGFRELARHAGPCIS